MAYNILTIVILSMSSRYHDIYVYIFIQVDVRLKLARDAMKQAETQARANSERSIQIAEQKEEETIR